jgi:hypothetical protein
LIRRSTSTLALLAWLSAFTPGLGCLVSFDGYRPFGGIEDGGEGGSSSAGESGSNAGRAGAGNAGRAGAGNAGKAGHDTGGTSGSANAGGSASSTAGRDGTSGAAGDGNESGDAGAPASGGNDFGGSGGRANGGASTGGSAGEAGSSGRGGSGGTGVAESCPVGLPGPALLEVPTAAGGFYCIDRTEVTNGQYAAFIATTPSTKKQGPDCSWNSSYSPEQSPECDPLPYDPSERPNNPVSCVDWCDARAYCTWAGKELCGAVEGGENPTADFAAADKSAWFRACTGGGATLLPYGNDYDGLACVGLDYGVVRAVNVATAAPCQGGYAGLWDMSGNVSEWENSCEPNSGPSAHCLHRGGSWVTPGEAALYCNSSLPSDTTPSPLLLRRDTHDEHIGFRCCYRP